MTGPGTFTDLNDGDQKNWFQQSAERGSSAYGAMADLADATSPPQMTAATISGRMELLQTLASPGQALLDNGLGFLVSIDVFSDTRIPFTNRVLRSGRHEPLAAISATSGSDQS